MTRFAMTCNRILRAGATIASEITSRMHMSHLDHVCPTSSHFDLVGMTVLVIQIAQLMQSPVNLSEEATADCARADMHC